MCLVMVLQSLGTNKNHNDLVCLGDKEAEKMKNPRKEGKSRMYFKIIIIVLFWERIWSEVHEFPLDLYSYLTTKLNC